MAQERRHLEAVQGEQLLEGFPEGISGGFIEAAEPPLQLRQHRLDLRAARLLQRDPEAAMGFLPPPFRQMPLEVAILMDRAALVDEFLATPGF